MLSQQKVALISLASAIPNCVLGRGVVGPEGPWEGFSRFTCGLGRICAYVDRPHCSSFEPWAFENVTPSGIGCTWETFELWALSFETVHVQPIPLGVTFSKAQSSKLERLFCHVSVKRDVRALSFEPWNSIRKCHPKWDRLYHRFLVVRIKYSRGTNRICWRCRVICLFSVKVCPWYKSLQKSKKIGNHAGVRYVHKLSVPGIQFKWCQCRWGCHGFPGTSRWCTHWK